MTGLVFERVARGAAWLDETEPGWRDSVQLSQLDLEDGCKCICGQVFADRLRVVTGFSYALMLYRQQTEHPGPPHQAAQDAYWWAVDHGFLLAGSSTSAWFDLQAAWMIYLSGQRQPEAALEYA